MSAWEPGSPVEDVEANKKAIKLEAQRHRRARYPRIDYYPSKEARAVILSSNRDYSSVINSIIMEWNSGIK